ncbi:MAG TPA: mobile mystery protein B [Pseudoxanthomonas sp.]
MPVGADDLFAAADDGATPLDPDECAGLIPGWVATRSDLNLVEQANIEKGLRWASRRRGGGDVLDEAMVFDLHRRMFNEVWRWAGQQRQSERNIGVAPHDIRPQLRQLHDDTRTWREFGTYPARECAARYHHRLVQIHVFANGNGRHARAMADWLLRQWGEAPFSWGNALPIHEARDQYLAALRAADGHDFGPLLGFLADQ